MNELRIGSVALLLLVSIPALAQNRRTDTALIELVRGCDEFKGGFQVVLNGAEWERTDAHLEDGKWVWTKTSAPRFGTNGSVASLRAGTWRSYCRRSQYDQWHTRDIAVFRFYCDSYPDQALSIDTHTSKIVITAIRNLPPDPADRGDGLDCPCSEIDRSGGTLEVKGLRLPDEVLLLRFLPWDGLGPGLRVFARTSQRLTGAKAFDRALCPSGCKSNEVQLTRGRLVDALGKQRLLNAQAAPNAYDVDHLLNRDVQNLTLTVK